MKISHIVTNGCSFTYCQGLEQPSTQGWPALLAHKFHSNLVNLGLPGVGNDNIHRRTFEYVYKNLSESTDDAKPLFIIAWSQPWRREGWFNLRGQQYGVNIKGIEFKDYSIVSFPHENPQDNYERALLDNWNEEDFIRKTLLYTLSLMNLFENQRIPYIMTNYAAYSDNKDIVDQVASKFPEIYNAVHNENKVQDLHELVYGYPKLPCGHDGEDAQITIANYLHHRINELYPNLEFSKNSSYLPLDKFAKGQKYSQKFPEWYKFKSNIDTI